MSDDLKNDFIWMRLIMEKVATFTELSTIISVSEMLKMNAFLDMRADSEAYSNYIYSKDLKKK